jgi:hypothetical protein
VSRMDSLLQYFKNIYKTKSMIDEYWLNYKPLRQLKEYYHEI